VRVGPYGSHLLVAGSPGGGKSTLVLGFLERLFQRGYQACIIDPEGDYPELEKAVIYGDSRRTPAVDAVVHALDQLQENVVVGLIGIKPEDRPAFFQKLMPALATLRARTGRPHWIIVDEAHHVLPASQQPALSGLPGDFGSTLLVTVRPQHVASSVLAAVNFVLVTGETPAQTLTDFCVATQCDAPPGPASPLPPGEALGWRRGQESVFHFRVQPPKVAHRRHLRQYAKGDLPAERSFYFEGPERKLHLRAQNLSIFLQISEGVDEETWNYHLQRGDYSAWFRTQFQDEDLALAVAIVEKTKGLSAENSRSRVRAAIEKRYSAAP
jgi:hypothetical protein